MISLKVLSSLIFSIPDSLIISEIDLSSSRILSKISFKFLLLRVESSNLEINSRKREVVRVVSVILFSFLLRYAEMSPNRRLLAILKLVFSFNNKLK